MTNFALARKPTAPYLRLLMTDTQDDARETDTLAPDTDRAGGERDTQPPDPTTDPSSKASLAAAMLPPRLSEPVKEAAIDQLLRMYQDARDRERDLLDADGKLAKINDERAQKIKNETIEQLSQVVDQLAGKPVQELSQRISAMADQLHKNDVRDSEQDAKLLDLYDRFEKAKTDFREIKATMMMLIEAGFTDKTALAGRKVLLVDDQEMMLRTLTRIASGCGATVLTASTLKETQFLVERFSPDCVAVDLLLGGEKGTDVVEWLLGPAKLDPARVLLMTGDAPAGIKVAAKYGLALIPKPMDHAELVQMLREASAPA